MTDHRVIRGTRFGRWTATSNEYKDNRPHRRLVIDVACDCGITRTVDSYTLRTGQSRSCGCLQRELMREKQYRHGYHSHPLYATWAAVVDRCTNPDNPRYAYYGGRGIAVAPDWLDSPVAFCDYIDATLGPRPKGHTLDRIDNDGDYSPGNVRWATAGQQSSNKRHASILRVEELEKELARLRIVA